MSPRAFKHWYRGSPAKRVVKGRASTPRGFRGENAAPAIRWSSRESAEARGGLAAGGVGAIEAGSIVGVPAAVATRGRAGARVNLATVAAKRAAAGATVEVQARVAGSASGGSSLGGVGAGPGNSSGRSFKHWTRGGALGFASARGDDFAHGYRGWFGAPAAGRIGTTSGVGTVAGGARVGGSAAGSGRVDHRPGDEAGRFDGRPGAFGGIAAVAATSAAVARGGINAGGAPPATGRGVVYMIFSNGGRGGPIDYASPIAEVSGLEWTTDALPPDSRFRFGLRARDAAGGLIDENLDAAASLVIDALGRDATAAPPAPIGLRAIDLGGGRVRLEWTTAGWSSNAATSYRVHLGVDAVTDFSSPIVVPANSRGNTVATEIRGLHEGRRHAAIVRAANALGEEDNTAVVFFSVDRSPPAKVDRLFVSLSAATA